MPDHDHTFSPDEHDSLLAELYRQTQEESDTSALDAQILAVARAETSQPSSNVVQLSAWRRWNPPLATAACLLLGVSVAFNVLLYRQTDDMAAYSDAPQASIEMLDQPLDEFEAITKPETLSAEMNSAAPVQPPAVSSAPANAAPTSPPVELRREPVTASPLIAEAPKPKRNAAPLTKIQRSEAGELTAGLSEVDATSTVQNQSDDAEELIPTNSRLRAVDEAVEEVIVSDIRLNPDSEISRLEHKIDEIIRLLENRKITQARNLLNELMAEYPELSNP